MKIPLVGASYVERSLPLDAQRSVNLYPVSDPQGSDVAALYGTPGLSLFATAGVGPVRGCFYTANNRAFVVSGSGLYELLSNGTTTLRGSLNGSSGIVTMAENGFQLGICDGDKVYMFTFLTNIFGVVTDPDLPSAGGIDFVYGYFVINKNNSGQFYISALYDGTSWNALDFATAESSPDQLVRAVSFAGQLGLLGARTLEIWRNNSTGNSFPFTRISGAAPIGCVSPYSVLSLDTSVYWIGANDQGNCIVYKAAGFSPERISTSPIERILQKVAQPELLRSWSYQEDGHVFYVITGSNLETSLVYDLNTSLWHERAYLNNGVYQQHLGTCCMYAFNKHMVGDRNNGSIYVLSSDAYSDNGNPIKRQRTYTHILNELKPTRYNSLVIGFETGVGLQTGQGSDPLMSLRISKDGAKTWSDYYTKSTGRVGGYLDTVTFRRLGINAQNTYEITMSDPIKWAITGSYLQ